MDVKKIAREKGMRLEQIADALGITKGGLSKALNGNPTLKTLRAVADVLQVPLTALFADEAEQQPQQQPTNVCPHCGKPINIKIENPEA